MCRGCSSISFSRYISSVAEAGVRPPPWRLAVSVRAAPPELSQPGGYPGRRRRRRPSAEQDNPPSPPTARASSTDVYQRPVGTGQSRGHRRPHGKLPGGGLASPAFRMASAGGTDKGDAPSAAHGVGKFRVFRQESVAGVQPRRTRWLCAAVEQRMSGSSSCPRPGAGPMHSGLGGQLDVARAFSSAVRIDRHRFNTRLPAGPPHPEGDLPPVGDQYPLQHG